MQRISEKIDERHFLFYFFSSLLPQLTNSYSRKPKDQKTLSLGPKNIGTWGVNTTIVYYRIQNTEFIDNSKTCGHSLNIN